jgi:hypothetical protein
MYEYGTLKPVEVILRSRWGKRENNGGDEPNQVHCKHIWKCHNETPIQLLHTNKNVKQTNKK